MVMTAGIQRGHSPDEHRRSTGEVAALLSVDKDWWMDWREAAMGARHVGVYPGFEPRLVVGESATRVLTLAEERDLGTYAPVSPKGVIDELERAGLRGRGGAGFPAAIKWRVVGAADQCVVVANGEEGEPASFKDRWLLAHRPHAVLDGLLLAADVLGAERALVYLSHPETVEAIHNALSELPAEISVRVETRVVAHRYVAGEESAVVRAINGGPALPTAKPPRVFESGVDDLPTLVQNVETLANAAWIARHGAVAYRSVGTCNSPGSVLVTLTGACDRPGVYEVPFGPSLRELFERCTGAAPLNAPGLIMGGWFAGIADPAEVLDSSWCYDALSAAGSAVGCGSVTVLSRGQRVGDVAAELARWYAAESAQQCGVCRKATEAIANALARVRDGMTESGDIDNLQRWGNGLRGKGACALLDGAANLARTSVRIMYPTHGSESSTGKGPS